jgi:hypothetical protein
MEESTSKPGIPFTPFRVALFTGLVVFGSLGAPQLAAFRDNVKQELKASLLGSGQPPSAQSAEVPLIRYKDDRGRTNYVSTMAAVPPKYRHKAQENVRLPKVTYQDRAFPAAPVSNGETVSPRVMHATSDPSRTRATRQNQGRSGASYQSPQVAGGDSGGPDTARSSHERESGDEQEGHLADIRGWLLFAKETFDSMTRELGG